MATDTIYDPKQDRGCLYDTVTMTAFGPVIDGHGEAERFLDYLVFTVDDQGYNVYDDPRAMSDQQLSKAFDRFCREGLPC